MLQNTNRTDSWLNLVISVELLPYPLRPPFSPTPHWLVWNNIKWYRECSRDFLLYSLPLSIFSPSFSALFSSAFDGYTYRGLIGWDSFTSIAFPPKFKMAYDSWEVIVGLQIKCNFRKKIKMELIRYSYAFAIRRI